MSSQHKLYNYSVTPPANAWKNIAEELDELQQFKTVSQKLQQLEAAPPPFAWDTIRDFLADEVSFNGVQQKLMNLEIEPPELSWSKIKLELDTVMPVPKAAIVHSGNFPWTKYAAAACIIGLLGFFGYRLKQHSNKETEGIIAKVEAGEKENQRRLSASLPASSRSLPIKNNTPPVTNAVATVTVESPGQVKTASGNTYITTVEKNKDIQGRYIVLMTEDGNVVRIAKKLGNMADCVAGEANTTDCDNQITQWQKEMAKAPVAATPDNFLDLLDLASAESKGM